MARILFMTSVYRFEDKGNLNVDLIDELVAQGHRVDVMTPVERRHQPHARMTTYPSLRVIEFPCLNFRGKVNLIEKGFSTLSLGYLYRHHIRKYLTGSSYDFAIYTTLPTTYGPALHYLKKRHGTFCYLLHKDIFPQSAVDLGLITPRSLPYMLFRRIERQLYEVSDMIGVMSQRNVEYIIDNNPNVSPSKVEVCPNSIEPLAPSACEELRARRLEVREHYSIPAESVVFLYGGNISRAQGIDFIIEAAERFAECPNAYLLFVGSGNEMDRLLAAIATSGVKNVGIIHHLDKAAYDMVAAACDVGLVFLDHRFTIANIPSRTLAHQNLSQPILAATDEFTDFRDFVIESGVGLWSPSSDVDAFLQNVRTLTADAALRNQLGKNARAHLESQGDTTLSYSIIAAHFSSRATSSDFDKPGLEGSPKNV